MMAVWDVAPCSLVEVYRRFRGACCFHHQGDGLKIGVQPTSRNVVNQYNEYASDNKKCQTILVL
jgi:hypothetical protein